MFKAFLDKLAAGSAARRKDAPEDELPLAAAALLVDAARSDETYDEAEKRLIDLLLADAYHLSPADAAKLRARGEAAQAEAVDTFRFTRAIKDGLEHDDRIDFMERLWRVTLADGQRDPAENALMRKLAGLLYIADQDSALARQRAEQALAQDG